MVPSANTIIIAEIGECYNGDIERAFKLIEAAKWARCDYAKFQTLDRTKVKKDDPEHDWLIKVALSNDDISALIKHAKKVGIGILFTPENLDRAKNLRIFGLKAVKIPSKLIVDHNLIIFVGNNFDRIFLSTGMATLDEINQCVNRLPRDHIWIMHCISEYPTGPLLKTKGLKALSPEDVHLCMMKMLMNIYPDIPIGYSDHTDSRLACIAAVAAGARVIEKHVTLDRKTPVNNFIEGGEYLGTDHVLSIEPDELKLMVEEIRTVEKIFGPWRWERTEGEMILKEFLRGRFQK
jgi:N,N'-diacetyllegionaminate synthase